MKIRFISLFFLFISIAANAQKLTDAVYLRNGSIIRGKISEQTNEVVKIETCCGSIFAFKPEEILEIKQEKKANEKILKDKGYFNLTSLGVLTGTGANEKEAPLSLIMEHIYRVNNFVAVGGIIGLETLNEAVMPVGLNLKGMLPLNGGGATYIGFNGGYSVSLEKPQSSYEITRAKGGLFLNPEIGFIAATGGNGSFFMAIGYRHNILNYVRNDFFFEEPVERKQIYNRLSIKIGICFH